MLGFAARRMCRAPPVVSWPTRYRSAVWLPIRSRFGGRRNDANGVPPIDSLAAIPSRSGHERRYQSALAISSTVSDGTRMQMGWGCSTPRQLNLDRLLLHTRRLWTTVRVALDRGTSDGSLVRGLADPGVWAPFSVGSPDKPGGFGRGNSRGHLAAEQRGCPSPPLSRAISPPFAAVHQWYASAHGDCQRTRFADEVEASALAKPMFAYPRPLMPSDRRAG